MHGSVDEEIQSQTVCPETFGHVICHSEAQYSSGERGKNKWVLTYCDLLGVGLCYRNRILCCITFGYGGQ